VVTTGTLGEILDVGDSDELSAQAETNLYGASAECGIDGIPSAVRDALAETTDLLHFDTLAQAKLPIPERPRVSRVKRLLAATVIANTLVAAGCTSGGRSSLDDLRKADAPYYYVGRSFDGYDVSDVLPYRAREASILYGTCKQPDGEGGCGPPLQLQHRLCLGVVTISIFAERDTARRAAKALRPLSKGARGANSEAGRRFRHGRQLLKPLRSRDIPAHWSPYGLRKSRSTSMRS